MASLSEMTERSNFKKLWNIHGPNKVADANEQIEKTNIKNSNIIEFKISFNLRCIGFFGL